MPDDNRAIATAETRDIATMPIGEAIRSCLMDGCGRPFLAQGRCKLHYHRDRRAGVIRARTKMTPEEKHERKRLQKRRSTARNPELNRQRARQWQIANQHRRAVHIARYRARKRQAMPAWADRIAIADIYRRASDLTRRTGIRHDVDHIVPMASPIVCGLHWEKNLQVIPRIENNRKGNRFWPNMPELQE